MIIVGEKINSSSKIINEAINKRDAGFIARMAREQCDAGADYIDLNAGIFYEDESERLAWLVSTVQMETGARLSLDTANGDALRSALAINKNGKPLINSITAQTQRFRSFLPLIKEFNASVVALCMDDGGLPATADERADIAGKLIEKLTGAGVKPEDIFLDPVVCPIGTDPRACVIVLETIKKIKMRWPGARIVCGVSNISYGLPARRLMNRTFLAAAIIAGLDCAILDPLDDAVLRTIYAAEALAGVDINCEEYLKKYRESGLPE